jgi:hypothetical protein
MNEDCTELLELREDVCTFIVNVEHTKCTMGTSRVPLRATGYITSEIIKISMEFWLSSVFKLLLIDNEKLLFSEFNFNFLNLKERDHFEDMCLDLRIILK